MFRTILCSTLAVFTTLTAFSTDAFAGDKKLVASTKKDDSEKAEKSEKVERAEKPSDDDDEKSESGFQIGARLGYALPMGSIAKDSNLQGFTDSSKYASGLVPIWLDAGYRITPNWYVGAYFQFAFMSTSGDFCKRLAGNNQCSSSGTNIRFGATARYSFKPQAKINPWVGVSTGYETQSMSITIGNQSGDASMKGFEFVGLHLGADVRVARDVTVGPMINASFGQYSSYSWSLPTFSGSGDYNNTALHQWVFLGIRGTYDL